MFIAFFIHDNVPNETIQELEAKYFQGDRVMTLLDDSIIADNRNLEQSRIILTTIFVGANGETVVLGGFLDLSKLLNPKGRSPLQDLSVNNYNPESRSYFVYSCIFGNDSTLTIFFLSNREKLFHRKISLIDQSF